MPVLMQTTHAHNFAVQPPVGSGANRIDPQAQPPDRILVEIGKCCSGANRHFSDYYAWVFEN